MRRNFPVLGRLRCVFEDLRSKIQRLSWLEQGRKVQ